MSALRRLAASVVMPGFVGTTVPSWLQRSLDEGLAGVCLFGHNVVDADQVAALTHALHERRPGMLVAGDEEGGTVTRLEAETGSSWPGHATLGALDDVEATRVVAAGIGRQARRLGVDLVLAPVVDVNSEPDNPVIGVRSFGGDTALVSRHGAAFVEGLQSAGVAACAKHFPGHGATHTDSHLTLPFLDADAATIRARDLPPFAAAVSAGVRCVMTAHVVARSLDHRPATTSPPLLRLLREELGFRGVVVTDALDMRAVTDRTGRSAGAVQALAAGADLLCLGNPAFPDPYDDAEVLGEVVDAVEHAVRAGTLSAGRLEEAAARVAELGAWTAQRAATASREPGSQSGDGLALGTEVARRALRVRGNVRVDGAGVVVVARTPVGLAAGRHTQALVAALRSRRPGWPVVELSGADEARTWVGHPADAAAVLVVEDRPDEDTRAAVDAVLAERPETVVVYGGLAGEADRGQRVVHTFGGGRATAEAAAELILGGAGR